MTSAEAIGWPVEEVVAWTSMSPARTKSVEPTADMAVSFAPCTSANQLIETMGKDE